MTIIEKEKLFKEIIIMASLFDRELKTEVAIAYIENLEDLPFDAVMKVIHHSVKTFDRFPMVAQIRRLVSPPEDSKDAAHEMSGLIFEAVRDYGSTNMLSAKQKLGPIAWAAVEKFGGWAVVCQTNTDDLPAVRAQLRDMCKAVMAMSTRSPDMIAKLPEYQRQGTLKLLDAIDKSFVDNYPKQIVNYEK